MSIKLLFEVSHLAQRKAKPTKAGFTHDWELYVKSPSGADLSYFVEKIIFNLHDTFVKPKRTIREPPFVVKESGYAAFEVVIEVYLKNKDEPRKFTFTYDLDLQPSKQEMKEFVIENPSDEFRRKCIKGGCQPMAGSSSTQEYKKPKRPDDNKTNKIFTDLFGAPLEKQQISKPDKGLPGQPSSASTSSGSKEKSEKSSKHKHPPGESKESKKSAESRSGSGEKVKKDKTKDRDRSSDKKEKSSKRAPSPSPSRSIQSSQSSQNLPPAASSSSKNDYQKPTHVVKPQTPIPDMSSTKKSSKKKNNEKDREKSERKESSKQQKEKSESSAPSKGKDRETPQSKSDERQKQVPVEPKNIAPETSKKYESKEPKHKHRKKDKTKEKEVKEKERKEPKAKSQPVKSKSHLSDASDSESDSMSKHEEVEKIPTPDKSHKKQSSSSRPEKSAKVQNEKEPESKKRKKKTRDSSRSPSPPPQPPAKQTKRDYSPNVVEKSANDSNATNNRAGIMKVPTDYVDELKEMKKKISALQTSDLHNVVRIIASTGHYEINNSSFDFDLIKLDKTTVQKLQEYLASA